jgi:K319L-like, PKD domain
MPKGFAGASSQRGIPGSFTSICLIGGTDCSKGLTPDLTVRGGARIKKCLYVGGATELAGNLETETVIVNGDATFLGNVYGLPPTIVGVENWSGGSTGFTPATLTNGNVIMAGTLNIASGGTGLSALGSPGQLLGVDVSGNLLEYKDDINLSGGATFGGDLFAGNGTISGKLSADELCVFGDTSVFGNLTGGGIFGIDIMGATANITGKLTADELCVFGDTSFFGNVFFSGNLEAGVSSMSGGSTGLTPNFPTMGHVVLAGVLNTNSGGTGLSVIGNSNQILGMNAGGISLEYKDDLVLSGGAIFGGNVIGNLFGDTFGKHTGELCGNVIGNVFGDLTGDVVGNVIGDLVGDTFGKHTGELFGDVVGNITGDVIGNVTGYVIGNISGTHFGDVIGNVTGNVIGNISGTHFGYVIGNVTGDVIGNISGTHFGDVIGNVIGDVIGNVTGDVVGDLCGNIKTQSISASDSNSPIFIDGNVQLGGTLEVQSGITTTSFSGDTLSLTQDALIGNSLTVANKITTQDLCVWGNLDLQGIEGNVDFNCSNISNVNTLFVDTITSKDVLGNLTLDGNVHITDTLFVSTIKGNSPVTFGDSVIIEGDTATNRITFHEGISVGSGTNALQGSIAIGEGAMSIHSGAIVLGGGVSSGPDKLHLNFGGAGNVTTGFPTMERPAYVTMYVNGCEIQLPCLKGNCFSSIIIPGSQTPTGNPISYGNLNAQLEVDFQDQYTGEQMTNGGFLIQYDVPGDQLPGNVDTYVSGLCVFDFPTAAAFVSGSMYDVDYTLFTPFNENPNPTVECPTGWLVRNTPILKWSTPQNVMYMDMGNTISVTWDEVPNMAEYAVSVTVLTDLDGEAVTHCYGNIVASTETSANIQKASNIGISVVSGAKVVGYIDCDKNTTYADQCVDNPPVNTPPMVNAGTDDMAVTSMAYTLSGMVSDDGNPIPPGSVTLQWTQQSGPGTASFVDDSSATSNVTFSVDGVYVLELSADDGLLTSSDIVTITVMTPFAPGSLDFSGGSDALRLPIDSDLILGSGDFTVEGFVKFDNTGNYQLFGFSDGGSASLSVNMTNTLSQVSWSIRGTPGPSAGGNGTGVTFVFPRTGVWLHFAWVRDGPNNTRFYIDGRRSVNFTGMAGNPFNTPTNPFTIGNTSGGLDAGAGLDGKITNFRIVKGTCLYFGTSSGVNFTPPTSQLTAIPGTVLLLNAESMAAATTDTSGLSKSVTNTGVVWSPDNPF